MHLKFIKLMLVVEDIPKDVWVIIMKQFTIKELVQMRQVCRYMNIVVKTKFQRFWFRRYIDLIIRTGPYAKRYKVNVPKIHYFHGAYLEEINLHIPYIIC
jgi:F-box domain